MYSGSLKEKGTKRKRRKRGGKLLGMEELLISEQQRTSRPFKQRACTFNIFKVRSILYEGSSANEAESKRRAGKWKGLRRKRVGRKAR